MKFHSTRGGDSVTLDEALIQGIAPDGGLFVPEQLPEFELADFDGAEKTIDVAGRYLAPFMQGSSLENDTREILEETFAFPVPVTAVSEGGPWQLELFHGPTAAFKDVGAAFLAACISRLDSGGEEHPLTILVATSGDTGGAVAAAFDKRPGVRVVVLYPDGRVSPRQAHQLSCWSDNVTSLAVTGSFDDCQAMVKAAMADIEFAARHRFSSANSINIGRLLPQSIYYADASLRHYREHGRKPSFIIPTGNLGNALACVIARECGLPIGDIVLATNANRLIADYLDGAEWEARSSLQTLASAMDVGNPSNMERLRFMLGEADVLNALIGVHSVDDEAIEAEIQRTWREHALAVCPHTATAFHAWRSFDDARRNDNDWVLVATAHPAKFESIVEPLIGEQVPLPAGLAAILERPSRFTHIKPGLDALKEQLDAGN